MKKRLAVLLGLLFVLIAAFASCANTAETAKYARWSESGETHTFKITLSDFANDGNTLFGKYNPKFRQKDDDGNITETTVTCYRDDVIVSNESYLMKNGDQICPVDATGTYTMRIHNDGANIRFETEQTLYSQYKTEDLQLLGCLDKLSERIVKVNDSPFENNDGRTTLLSKTSASVIFANNAENPLPVSSVSENKGFYIGKIAQSVSSYKYETTYDFDKRTVTVKKDNGEAEERKLNLAKGKSCIDANQLILYIRSLDKSSAAFQDSPSVSVYDVTTDSICTASFTLNRQFNLLLGDNDNQSVISTNAVLTTVDGLPFMAQYNLPDISSVDSGYDYLPLSSGRSPKYTAVKFRSGWYSYELQPDEIYQQTIDAIKIKNVTE